MLAKALDSDQIPQKSTYPQDRADTTGENHALSEVRCFHILAAVSEQA